MTLLILLLLALGWGGLYLAVRNHAQKNGGVGWPLAAETIAAGGLLALAAVGFFWQLFFTDNSWMPAGGGDLAPFLYPNYDFAARHLKQGNIPLWNPHLYSGVPFAADIQAGLFYPINLLLFLAVPTLTYTWLQYLAVFHFWLAGVTMYLLLRVQSAEFRIQNSEYRLQNEEGRREINEERNASASSVDREMSQNLPPSGGERGGESVTPTNLSALEKGKEGGPPIPPLAAFAGALAFQFSDLFIVHFGNLNMIAVAAWLPLVFLLFQQSLRRRSLGWAAASGATLAGATLAGHIQITLFILLTLGLYALWQLLIINYQLSIINCQLSITNYQLPIINYQLPIINYQLPIINYQLPIINYQLSNKNRALRVTFYQALQPLLALSITLAVTIGLSALLLLPAYEMSQHTPRAGLPYAEAAAYSLHPAQLVGLLAPNYFGRDPALHWGPWERVETGYIGLMPLLLAVIGAALYPGRLKQFLVGLGVIALLLALGGASLLHGWLYAIVPGFDQMRAPARFILLLDFSLAALAAMGLAVLLRWPWPAPTERVLSNLLTVFTWIFGGLIIVAGPLAYFALLVTQDRNPAIFNRAAAPATAVATFAIFAIAALVVLHLVRRHRLHGWGAGLAVIGVIALDLFTLGYDVDVGHSDPLAGFHHPEAITFLQNDPNLFRIEVTTDVWHAWQPNTALLNDLYDVWGLYNPLTLADTTLYWSGAPPRSSGRYNFLGVKYIIASKAGAPADGNIVPIFDADPQVNIYLNQDALARALFVGKSEVVADHDAAWEAIRAEEFDPAQTVILEGGQSLNNQPSSSLAIMEYGPERVVISVETDQPGYLVLADAYYPGWQATVDGQPTPIERANYAFRALYVPEGQHTVQFEFRPVIWQVGLALSAVTMLGLLGWAGWRWRQSSAAH